MLASGGHGGRGAGVFRRKTHAERRKPAALPIQPNRYSSCSLGLRPGLADDGQRDLLLQMLAFGESVWPWQRQWADIGLVGCVHPVALVFHLIGVALHAAGDLGAGCELMSDCPHV